MLEKGLSARSAATVAAGNTAAAMGSGDVTHIKPSGLGAEITATAVLAEVEGRKLTFNVGARDAEGLIGEGIHVRYIVDREKFMAKVK